MHRQRKEDALFETLETLPPARDAGGHPTGRGPAPMRRAALLPPALEKVAPGHPQHLLRLACQVLHANLGGIGLLSVEGKLIDHIAFGLTEQTADEMLQSTWLAGLIGLLVQPEAGARVIDTSGELGRPEGPSGLPPLGPLLGAPLASQGRCWGALYLSRPPGAPAFGPAEEEILGTICSWLKESNLLDEGLFLARQRLLSEVAQAGAGSLDLARIFAVALRGLNRHLPVNVCAVWLTDKAPRSRPHSKDGLQRPLP